MDESPEQDQRDAVVGQPTGTPEATSSSRFERAAVAFTLATVAAIAFAFVLRAESAGLRAASVAAGSSTTYDLALIATLLVAIVPLADLIGRRLSRRPMSRWSGPLVVVLAVAWLSADSAIPTARDISRSSDFASWTRSLDLPERTIASNEPARRICDANPVLPFHGPDSPPWRGRQALPVDGPDAFIADVQHVLDDLAAFAPLRYREALEYLPQADWDPAWLDETFGPGQAAAASNGKFGIDADDYGAWQFERIFLHEVGHNVRQHLTTAYLEQGLPEDERSQLVERHADEYAAAVLAEIAACRAIAPSSASVAPSR